MTKLIASLFLTAMLVAPAAADELSNTRYAYTDLPMDALEELVDDCMETLRNDIVKQYSDRNLYVSLREQCDEIREVYATKLLKQLEKDIDYILKNPYPNIESN